MVCQTILIMELKRTKAKYITVFSQKRNTQCCRFFLTLPSSVRRGPSVLALALFGFVPYCWLLGQCYIPEFHATPFTFTIPSLPNFMPVGFHSTINLLFSMEMSGNQWGNPPLASAGYFFAALCLQWTWQSYCAGTAKWMELGAIQMAPESAETSFSLTSVSIGLGPPKAESMLLPLHISLWFRVVSHYETQVARKPPCTYSVK